jgi:hypothetical protein
LYIEVIRAPLGSTTNATWFSNPQVLVVRDPLGPTTKACFPFASLRIDPPREKGKKQPHAAAQQHGATQITRLFQFIVVRLPYFSLVAGRGVPMITVEQIGLSAVRLIEEIRPMGYQGSAVTVCRYLSSPKSETQRSCKVTVRFETSPGQQAQTDWTYCGELPRPKVA